MGGEKGIGDGVGDRGACGRRCGGARTPRHNRQRGGGGVGEEGDRKC